jgi:translation initiation factor IF-3
MNRGGGLPGGIANLNDTIQVIDRDGTDLGLMIVAEAQRIASEQGAELFVTNPDAKPPIVRIVLVRKARME